MHPTVIEINRQQLELNLKSIKHHIANRKILLPVKANAYGHGLIAVAEIAQPLVDYFGVACLDEGIRLRLNGITKPILVFGAIDAEQIPGLVDYDLEITISSLFKAVLVHEFCVTNNKICKVQIKVDTGMNRVGVRPDTLMKLLDYIASSSVLQLTGVYSHFAMSEDLDQQMSILQLSQFQKVVNEVKKYNPLAICHIANSGGVCYYPESYFDMVRPGILAYGYFPGDQSSCQSLSQIKPCFTLKSRVVYFKVVAAFSGISYNHRYHTSTDTRIVTIPIGYGDGYRRGLSNIGEVLLRGKRYKISGTICMDMFMVDIGADNEAYVGDEVVLIGSQGDDEILISELAAKLNTIIYEVLVGFNERIPRVVV